MDDSSVRLSAEPKKLDEIVNNLGIGKFHIILLLICGIFQACDAMEMMILTFLGPLLKCAWQIDVINQSLLTSAVFVGMLFGGPLFGKCCDLYGRKSILTYSTLLLAYIGLMCAGAPNMVWILILRGMIGASLGGVMSSISTYLSELYPMKYRGRIILIVFSFWAFGSLFITGMCLVIVPAYGWRIFLVISTFPLIALLPTLLWLPESPRFLLLKNYKQTAIDVLNRIAASNNKPPIKDIDIPTKQDHSIMDLFHPNYWATTLLCMFNWFVCGMSYYGGVLLIALINTIPKACLQDMSRIDVPVIHGNQTDDSCCFIISVYTFQDTFISIVGEVALLPIPFILINLVGRKATMGILATIITIGFFLLNLCMDKIVLDCLLFILRGCLACLFNVNYVYASEVFPTSVRSVGVGICNGSARIGAMIAPFIVNVIILNSSFLVGTMVFCIFNCIILVTSILLPYETRDRVLCQTAHEDPYQKVPNKSDYIEVK